MKTTFVEELKFGRHLIAFAKNPGDLDRIRKLGNIAGNLRDQRAAHAVVEHAMKNAGYRRLYEGGYSPDPPDLKKLATLPQDTRTPDTLSTTSLKSTS